MTKRKRLLEWEPAAEPRHCERPGCREGGLYRAPHSRAEPEHAHWFCLEHAREYNAGWNFFEGMTREEIERFVREDVTGHRPTWPLGLGPVGSRFGNRLRDHFDVFAEEGLAMFGGGRRGRSKDAPPERRPEERRALAKLNLSPESTLQEIKRRYKELVKRYHPDVTGGDRQAEEQLKAVNEAYETLRGSGT